MKHINHLFSLFLAITLSVSAWGSKSDPIPSGTAAASRVLPIATKANEYPYNPKTSFSQSIYTKAELGASAKVITDIEFFIHTSVANSATRTLQVWIKEIEKDSFEINPSDAQFYLIYDEISGTPKQYLPGTKVFSGSITIPASGSYTIHFDTEFEWSGNKNICVTVADLTCTSFPYTDLRHAIVPTDRPRFNYRYTNSTSSSDWLWVFNNSLDFFGLKGASELRGMKWLENAAANVAAQCDQHKYAPKAVFTFKDAAPSPTPPASAPDDLAVSATTATSATLAWSSVSGATSYDLQQSANGSDWSTLASGVDAISFNWTGLSVASTIYVRIRATNSDGSSDWSSPVTVTTDALHEHNDITFDKWVSTTSLPTAGNYYLNDNVTFTTSGDQNITLTGNLNLCLNGKTANLSIFSITVPSGKTLTIYDNVGGGKLTSFFGAQVGWTEDGSSALIRVKSGGTLVLKEGVIENSYNVDDAYFSYAIYSNGTLIMSGAPVINSNDADIYLAVDGVITLDGALTNSEKYSVAKFSGTIITTGWGTHMSGEKPRDFFVSADDSHSVSLNEGEAVLISAITLADNVDNSSTMSSKFGLTSNIIIGRSFSSASYNTICLPFDLSNAQLQDVFGAGYDLQEFVGSEMDGETLMLNFSQVTALEAGKPYVIQPESNVSNPTFEGVRISETEPEDPLADANILFHGVLVPTSLTGGNKNLLFLGAGNELFWPESTNNLKSFRAYFEVLGGVVLSPGRVRMAFNSEKAAQGLESIQDSAVRIQKVIRDGKLIIIRDGREYNAQGILIR